MKFFSSVFGQAKTESDKPPVVVNDEFKKKAKEGADIAWDLMNSTDNWKLEKKTSNGDTVHSKHLPGVGKVFRLTGEANFPAKRLMRELFFNIDDTPKWNPTMLESKRTALDDSTDVLYQVTAPAAGGLVSSRDFVSARHYSMRDGCFMTGGMSIDHPDVPPNDKYIRGENGPGGWSARPIKGVEDRCTFQWLINTRLNGWLPQYVVDMAFTNAMLDYLKHIRTYGEKLREQRLMDD